MGATKGPELYFFAWGAEACHPDIPNLRSKAGKPRGKNLFAFSQERWA